MKNSFVQAGQCHPNKGLKAQGGELCIQKPSSENVVFYWWFK